MRHDIAPGGTFPDHELPDHESFHAHHELQEFRASVGDRSRFHGWDRRVVR